MISTGFSTSFQTNTAVSESQWSKLFDLRYKKFLLIGCVYIGLDWMVLIPFPNQGSCMGVALQFFPLKLHLSQEFVFSVLK